MPLRRLLQTAPVLALAALLAAGCSPAAKHEPAARDAGAPIDTAGLPEIRFQRGTTSLAFADSLPDGGTKSYFLGALERQRLTVHVLSRQDDVDVDVLEAATGRQVAPVQQVPSFWAGLLPSSGNFIVRITGRGKPEAYWVKVQIPRRVILTDEFPTQSYSGVALPSLPVDYVLKGVQGKTVTVELRTAETRTALNVYGIEDGTVLLANAAGQQKFAGAVPKTQDYMISVVPAAEDSTDYALFVTQK
jgi:hypothetical protein